MPRKLTPDALKTGSGKRPPEKGTTIILGGAGMSGPGPNIGSAEWLSLSGAKNLPSWLLDRINAAGGMAAHLSEQGAHKASSISATGVDDGFGIVNVQDGLIDLHGALPLTPPSLGVWRNNDAFGVPDWGVLKVDDRDLATRGLLTGLGAAAADQTFPYFYKAPSPLIPENNTTPFSQGGGDPQSDSEWNSGLDHGVDMYGTGEGAAFVGGFTRDGSAVSQELMRTAQILVRPAVNDDLTALPLRLEATISGSIYPADRGVLALIHWPPGTVGVAPTVPDFLAQNLDDRVVAALLLGQGILGENCNGDCTDNPCDGEPGGIFAVGQDANGKYDPAAFPGRASGQYDLAELFAGVNRGDSSDLQDPFAGGIPVVRVVNDTTPAPGQVRLGTDPNGNLADPTTYGIPVLGGNIAAYDLGTPPATLANVAAPRIGHVVVGSSVVSMEDPATPGAYLSGTNFFRYRLPVLKEYSVAGLKWTPTGNDPTNNRETFRFFDKASPSNSAGTLASAGNYGTPFSEDQIAWQVARYRHTFLLPSTAAVSAEEEIGSYWLIHFKKERDFEAFVRDGVMPWDATDGYDIYGADTYTTADPTEADGNVVNEQLSTAPFQAPFGPAPDFHYLSQSYFTRRNTIFLEGDLGAPAFTGTFDWVVNDPTNSIVWVSGVAHFTPRSVTGVNAGDGNLEVSALDVAETTTTFFDRAFRTEDRWVDGERSAPIPANTDPALISSPSPAFVSFFPFAYGPHPSPPAGQLDGPSATFPLDDDTALSLSSNHTPRLPSRIEIPFTHTGPGGAGIYSDSNGPQSGDALAIGVGTGANIILFGDDEDPAFTMRARPRAFFRRPTLHSSTTTAIEPYSANDGHGILCEPVDAAEILLHTTRWDDTNLVGEFGNFMVAGAFPVNSYAGLFTAEKDVYERFLDETYRYPSTFDVDSTLVGTAGLQLTVYGTGGRDHLIGPGMFAWAGGPIEVPVRAGYNNAISSDWAAASWLPMGIHEVSLVDHGVAAGVDEVGDELQVTGWPDRNPPLSDRASAPFPSTGLLLYPRQDFTTVGSPNIRPSGPLGASDLAVEQPDYSALTATRSYVRAFDASFGQTVSAAGQPFVTIRIDGVTLDDLAYAAPGPGGLNRLDANLNSFIAVLIKVPGLTTWMDVGRADGAGPGKQDALLDGAGCQIVGPETISGFDSETAIPYAQIKCNVGPAANLFASSGIEGTVVGEVPVLVKVLMKQSASAFDMATEFDGTDFVGAAPGPGLSTNAVRGVCGIRLISPA